jgi:signal-transduction protein with cAMP-binding, CBS, and nucleotidyltransferase domain
MALLVSAKGSDVLAWRACGDFTATFRQQLLSRLEFYRSDETGALLSGVGHALDDLVAANDAFCLRSSALIDEAASCNDAVRFKTLTAEFYSGLYEHIGIYHSVPAFYESSTFFLKALSGAIIRRAISGFGISDRQFPPLKLIAVGPAGRQEFSPFCPLHLLLIHGAVGHAEQEIIAQLGRLIHEGFESCGFQVDKTITPRNKEWRGSLPEWQHRLAKLLDRGEIDDLIDFFRLADQTVLFQDHEGSSEFFHLFKNLLKQHRSAMAFQVTRVRALSHGIGIMGGMRFEKKGPYRGKFALLDNALQPLSAALSSLALLKNLDTAATPQRVREVLWRRELNVDMAERVLQAWHSLHELRLIRELTVHPDWSDEGSLHLDIDELNDSEQTVLRESLDTVGVIQRHVGLTFSGMEE